MTRLDAFTSAIRRYRRRRSVAKLVREGYVKVRMSDQGHTETAWAVRVVPGEDRFRLDNAPFFAYGVSDSDVVEGRFVAEGLYDFVRVVERSGNRTVRLIFGEEKADTPTGRRVLAGVVALGCTVEGMNKSLMSITVPAQVDLGRVADYLTSTGLDWESADPTYAELTGEDPDP